MPQERDLIDQYISNLQQQEGSATEDPIDAYIAQRYGSRPGVLSKIAGWTGSRLEAMGEFTEMLTNPLGALLDPMSELGQRGVESAAVQGTVAQSLANLLNVPEAIYGGDVPVTSRAADFIERYARGVISKAEVAAIQAGASPEDIAASYDVGNFIGFTAPMVGSIGIANLMFRAPMLSTISSPIARNFVTDFSAGLIYGGIFQEGDREQRLKNMLNESAVFGATSLILGPFTAVRAYRFKRAKELSRAMEIVDLVARMELGEEIVLRSPDQVRGVIQLLNEETFLSNSDAAQRLLEINAQDEALLSGIRQLTGTRGTAGVMRNFGGQDFFAIQARVERFREQFPGLKFDLVKREVTDTVEELEEETIRFYRGQGSLSRARHSDDPSLYFTTDQGVAEMYALDGGKVYAVDVPRSVAEAGGYGSLGGGDIVLPKEYQKAMKLVDEIGPIPPRGKITKDVTRNEYDVFFGTKGLNNKQRVQMKKEGRFAGQILQRGNQNVEYIGLSKKKGYIEVKRADGKKLNIKASSVTDTPFIAEITERTPRMDGLYQSFREFLDRKNTDVLEARGGVTERDVILGLRDGTIKLDDTMRRAFDAGGGLVYPEQLGITPQNMINEVIFGQGDEHIARLTPQADGSWVLQEVIPGTMQPQQFSSIEEAMTRLQQLPVAEVKTKLATADETMQAILQDGVMAGGMLEPMPVYNFEDMFDAWAKQAGLAEDAADYLTTRAFFAQEYRKEMWATLPDAEKEIFNNLLREQEELLARADVPVNVLARSKGFHAEEMKDGRVRLREVNTGFSLDFGSPALARNALNQIVRNEKDMLGLTPEFMHSLGQFAAGGYGSPMDVFEIPDDILSPTKAQLLPWTWFRNRRDYFIAIEQETGIPIWSQGYQLVLEGHDRQLAELDTWAKQIHAVWRPIPTARRNEIAKLWSGLEEEGITTAQAIQRFKAEGFNALEISAFSKSRAMMDIWFRDSGIDPKRYINTYYSRIRPYFEKHGYVDPRELKSLMAQPEFEFWAEFSRTGDMALIEMDPEIVLHKYIRSQLFVKHVKDPWDKLARLVGTKDGGITPLKIKDLPAEKQRAILQRAMPGTTADSPVIPEEIRGVTAEFLNALRGMTSVSVDNLRTYSQRMFRKLGVQVDEKVGEELINNFVASMYGSAMGLRPASVARNLQQNVWMLYTRIGNKHMGPGLERAMTQEGYNEVFDEGVLRLAEAGIPFGNRIFETLLEGTPAAGIDGASSRVLAANVQRALRVGRLSREIAQKFLVPFSSSDQVSRAWSYWAQKLHTDDWLTKFEAREISWEKFQEEGLPFFNPVVKKAFHEEYNRHGRERALRFIGRMGSDETNFIYGVGTQPGWMQSVPGRLAGMFGQWPMWALELYTQRIRNGTVKQRSALILRTAILAGAYANIAHETGSDMWSWIAPISPLNWGGGPFVQFAIDLSEVMSAPMDRKAGAFTRLARDIGRISLPGQGFWRDMRRALDQDSPEQALFSTMLGRPVERGHFALDALYQLELSDPIVPADRILPTPGIPDLPDPLGSLGALGLGAGDEMEDGLPPLRQALSGGSSSMQGPDPSVLLGNIR